MIQHWKFVNWEVDTIPMEFKDKESLHNFLAKEYANSFTFGFNNLSSSGIYRLGGRAYDFKPYLQKILVKQYDRWQEYYAPNKTTLRKCLYGRVQKMVYV